MHKSFGWRWSWVALAILLCTACRDSSTQGSGATFESDVLEQSTIGPAVDAGSVAMPSTTDDAQRLIVEADIIQISGQRLYALSRAAGLSVIDLTDPAHLLILGRYRELNGTPFEMYLRGGVVLAMYSSWGQYVKQPDGQYAWTQTSKVVALDVGLPTAITQLGSFDVAGDVSDSRMVGDVLYVVGYQNGFCWGCSSNKPQTSILSLNVADPHQVRKVDELFYSEQQGSYGWSKRSVSVTAQRMYVAGPVYGASQPSASTIQVVDISDPGGDLVEGTKIAAAGQISSRWQMDEYQGTLRVISQNTTPWGQPASPANPTVQTFRIDSSQSVVPLGQVALVVPANETLRTVRFDGPRGYAITSVRHDPLFTLDLTDPANPRQVGQLELPGWIYHLVPRGDRLIGLGYDQGNSAGAITVSLFDVANLAAPKLLERVNFGGDWAYLPEDQDRIQKAFRVLDELGLILVPFSGWSGWKPRSGCASGYRSGVQLVDLTGDHLTLRGAAPARGEARRAFLYDQKLITVSDEAVDAYDLSNRDEPTPVGRLNIARNVSHALLLENQAVARINEDWYGSQNSSVDVVRLADVDHAELSLAELDLAQLLRGSSGCAFYTSVTHAFAVGNQLTLSYTRWNTAVHAELVREDGVLVIDASDPSKPAVISNFVSPTVAGNAEWGEYWAYYRYGYGGARASAVRTSQALTLLEQRTVVGDDFSYSYEARLRVVNLTDPAHPSEVILSLPKAEGYGGLVVDGNDVLLSHYERTTSGRAHFFLDRLDLSQPARPVLSGKVNVPGSLLHYDRARGRMLMSELSRIVVSGLDSLECSARFGFAAWEPTSSVDVTGTCTGYVERLHLVRYRDDRVVLEDTYALADDEQLSSSSLGDGRVAAVISHAGHRDTTGACSYCLYPTPAELLSLGGFDSGHLTTARLGVSNTDDAWGGFWSSPQVYASGSHALVQGFDEGVIVDLTDPLAPSIVRRVPLLSSWSRDLSGVGNVVLLSFGESGVQRVDL